MAAPTGQAVYVRIQGAKELADAAGALVGNVQTTAEQRFALVAQMAGARLAAALPVLTGRLAATARGWPTPGGATVGHGAGIPYAGWIEFGGGHGRDYVPGGRYLMPTVLDMQDELLGAATDAAEGAIDKTSWWKGA